MIESHDMNLLFSLPMAVLLIFSYVNLTAGCGPGRGPIRRRGPRKILPLIYKQHEPNFSEKSLAAAGLPEGSISRQDKEFRKLVPNYNPDIIFKDEEGTGADRIMTLRCKEKLNTLAISVMNQWPGLRLRVTEAWDEENHHARDSLHYEGRAVDVTTSDRDRRKYGLLASLAVEAGFDWVYYESRSHVHASCKSESAEPGKNAGCFPEDATVQLESGARIAMGQLRIGDRIATMEPSTGNIVFSEVLLFLDRDVDMTRAFVNIKTASGQVLSITETHLVHVVKEDKCDGAKASCVETIYAGNVQVGYNVLVTPADGRVFYDRVESVNVKRLRGVYAPLTATGTLVVDNVVASAYAVIDSQSIAHAAFAPVRWACAVSSSFKSLFSWLPSTTDNYIKEDDIDNEIISDNTLLSKVTHDQDETPRTLRLPSVDGIHWYADMLYSIADYILPQHLVRR